MLLKGAIKMSAESTEIPTGIDSNAVLRNLLLSGKISLEDITQADGKIVQQLLPLKKASGVIDLCDSDDEDDAGDDVYDLKTAAIKAEEDDEQTTVCDGVGITSFKIEKKR